MTRFTEFIRNRNKPLVLDGALGSVFLQQGLQQGAPPESWLIEKPDLVKTIHAAYYQAGSIIVHTNSFGANRIRLSEFGLDSRIEELNQAAVSLVQQVRPPDGFIAGDMGPTGKLLKPLGPVEYDQWIDAFTEQAGYLADAGVDLISIETMYDLREAVAALRAATTTNLPVWVSMTFRKTPRGYFTIMGNSLETCFNTLLDEGADSIGVNCTLNSSQMKLLVQELDPARFPRIHIQPNAGEPVLRDGNPVYDQTPPEFAKDIVHIVEYGIAAAGGCCGTTPEFIKEICNRLRK